MVVISDGREGSAVYATRYLDGRLLTGSCIASGAVTSRQAATRLAGREVTACRVKARIGRSEDRLSLTGKSRRRNVDIDAAERGEGDGRKGGRKEERFRDSIGESCSLSLVSLDASKDTRDVSDNDGGEIFYANDFIVSRISIASVVGSGWIMVTAEFRVSGIGTKGAEEMAEITERE
jgi:hypothetical protein